MRFQFPSWLAGVGSERQGGLSEAACWQRSRGLVEDENEYRAVRGSQGRFGVGKKTTEVASRSIRGEFIPPKSDTVMERNRISYPLKFELDN